jgi:hypothetical protein
MCVKFVISLSLYLRDSTIAAPARGTSFFISTVPRLTRVTLGLCVTNAPSLVHLYWSSILCVKSEYAVCASNKVYDTLELIVTIVEHFDVRMYGLMTFVCMKMDEG